MDNQRRILLVSAIVGLVAVGIAAGLAAATPGAVHIERIHFVQGPSSGGNLTIDGITYVTSHGSTSRDVRIVAFLYPQATGIAIERQEIHVGRVAGASSAEARLTLHLVGFDSANAKSWGMDFLVFEDGLLTQEGQGTIGYRGYEGGGVYLDKLQASAGPFAAVG